MPTIQLRRDTAATWTSRNPTLAQGEPGLETDTNKHKVGDGSTAWNSLAYYAISLDAVGGYWDAHGLDLQYVNSLYCWQLFVGDYQSNIYEDVSKNLVLSGFSGLTVAENDFSVTGTTRIGGATGVWLTAATGVLTLQGKKTSGNNESLLLDFETTANTVLVTSGTGVTKIDFGASIQVNAKSFVTSGGTSAKFVKGDGSLDPSTYLTSSDLAAWAGSTNITTLGTIATCAGLTVQGSIQAYNASYNCTVAANSVTFTRSGGDSYIDKADSNNLQVRFGGSGVATKFVMAGNGRLSIGHSGAPEAALDIRATDSGAYCQVYAYRSDTGGSGFIFGKARGTIASPTKALSGDYILNIFAMGHSGNSGTGFVGGATIRAVATEDYSTTTAAAKLELMTTSSGATSPTVRVTIRPTGIVNIAGVPTYANNAAAITGGLVAGDLYRNNADPDLLCIVH